MVQGSDTVKTTEYEPIITGGITITQHMLMLYGRKYYYINIFNYPLRLYQNLRAWSKELYPCVYL